MAAPQQQIIHKPFENQLTTTNLDHLLTAYRGAAIFVVGFILIVERMGGISIISGTSCEVCREPFPTSFYLILRLVLHLYKMPFRSKPLTFFGGGATTLPPFGDKHFNSIQESICVIGSTPTVLC